jgi:hypothetical protein
MPNRVLSAGIRLGPTDGAASKWPGITIRKDAGWLDPGTR